MIDVIFLNGALHNFVCLKPKASYEIMLVKVKKYRQLASRRDFGPTLLKRWDKNLAKFLFFCLN
jgi:hypothetical protein